MDTFTIISRASSFSLGTPSVFHFSNCIKNALALALLILPSISISSLMESMTSKIRPCTKWLLKGTTRLEYPQLLSSAETPSIESSFRGRGSEATVSYDDTQKHKNKYINLSHKFHSQIFYASVHSQEYYIVRYIDSTLMNISGATSFAFGTPSVFHSPNCLKNAFATILLIILPSISMSSSIEATAFSVYPCISSFWKGSTRLRYSQL